MLAGYSFRPRVWPWLLALCACAATVALGNWQSRRAEEKRALGARFEQTLKGPAIELDPSATFADVAGRRVSAHGVLVAERTLFLDNKLHAGRVGYEVLTPLRLAGSASHVLVERGWIAAPPTRDVLPRPRTPEGEIRLSGIALERLPHALEGGAPQPGPVRQNVDVVEFAHETKLALLPFVLREYDGPDDGLARDWPRPDTGIEMHQSYALQWDSFAALSLILALVFSFVKK